MIIFGPKTLFRPQSLWKKAECKRVWALPSTPRQKIVILIYVHTHTSPETDPMADLWCHGLCCCQWSHCMFSLQMVDRSLADSRDSLRNTDCMCAQHGSLVSHNNWRESTHACAHEHHTYQNRHPALCPCGLFVTARQSRVLCEKEARVRAWSAEWASLLLISSLYA